MVGKSYKRWYYSFIKKIYAFLKFARRNGIIIAIEELINRTHLWSTRSEILIESSSKTQTSMSDTPHYLSVCKLACDNSRVFSKFKSNRDYRKILEHVTYEQGLEYLEIIERDPFSLKVLEGKSYLEVGKPFKYRYKKYGRLSPTYLRYLKITGEIYSLFGNLSSFKIAEIGVGAGGLCEQILSSFDVHQYDLFDLPDVLTLAVKCLSQSNIADRVNPRYNSSSSIAKYDLVISNYAFSELTREVQMHYLNEVILKSKHGYLIYNHISPDWYNSLSAKEFCRLVPEAVIRPEEPLTHKDNVLITW